MPEFQLVFEDSFEKDVQKLDNSIKKIVEKAVYKIKENPLAGKPLKGVSNYFRMRFLNYRLIYKVEASQKKIVLLNVIKRKTDYTRYHPK
ncbi:type II toxin-antitoxin system RelE/ParE family toxin [Candidatus Micrarchaeota archaeon]|nr:type II toxin-antitoxin system RelE/ParE family toxin [Candidatus Micrarchaeota archaeon]